MGYSDDIWQEGQEDECVDCGRSGQTCDCDYQSPVVFEETQYSTTEDFVVFKGNENKKLHWTYLYNEKGVVAKGEVIYDMKTKKYEVTVDSTSDDSMETVIEHKVGEVFEESDLK